MAPKKKRPTIPPLCGVTEVALILEVDRTTIPGMRRLKDFPEPIIYIGKRPVWLESEVIEYQKMRVNKRKILSGGNEDVH